MKNNIKKIIIVAILKGIIHASVVPISLMFAMIYLTNNLWALLTPFVYLFFAAFVYTTSKDKDISKIAFFKTLGVVFAGAIIYLLIVMA